MFRHYADGTINFSVKKSNNEIETANKKVQKKIPLYSCFVAAKTKTMFKHYADGTINFSVKKSNNETFGTSFAPWFEDRKLPYGCYKPTNVTHFPHAVASTQRPGRRTDAVGLVTGMTYTEGKGNTEEDQRSHTRISFTLSGRYCKEFYVQTKIWGEPAIELFAKYGKAKDASLIAFIKNAGIVEYETGQEMFIELTSEYNTIVTFIECTDPRVQESKLNIVADKITELPALTNDIENDGEQRFVEEVFIYADHIETNPFEANKVQPGASAGSAGAASSPVQKHFQPRPLFDSDDDDEDNDQLVLKTAEKKTNQDTTVGESKSDKTNVANNDLTKKGPSHQNATDSEDDDDDEQTPTKESPQKPKSTATKTSKPTPEANPAARATQKTLGKDTDDADVDNDDDDLTRVSRRSKKRK